MKPLADHRPRTLEPDRNLSAIAMQHRDSAECRRLCSPAFMIPAHTCSAGAAHAVSHASDSRSSPSLCRVYALFTHAIRLAGRSSDRPAFSQQNLALMRRMHNYRNCAVRNTAQITFSTWPSCKPRSTSRLWLGLGRALFAGFSTAPGAEGGSTDTWRGTA